MPKQQAAPGGIGRLLAVLAVLTALLTSVVYMMEQNLEKFFIFEPGHLHDLSKRAIAEHGDDTAEVVKYIVSELHEKHPNYVNLEQEWVFNNAGGAMGGMYIIHASEYFLFYFFCVNLSFPRPIADANGPPS